MGEPWRDQDLTATSRDEWSPFSGPALDGPAAILGGVEAFFQMLDGGIEHRLEAAWTSADALVWRAEVTWSLRDGRRISAPYVNILRFVGELVSDYRVHVVVARAMRSGLSSSIATG